MFWREQVSSLSTEISGSFSVGFNEMNQALTAIVEEAYSLDVLKGSIQHKTYKQFLLCPGLKVT